MQDADLVGWFSWAGTQIDKNDTGSHHLYPEVRASTQWSEICFFCCGLAVSLSLPCCLQVRSDGDAMFARLVVDQAVEDTTLFTLMALKSGASPVQHAFDLVVLEGTCGPAESIGCYQWIS